MWEGKLEREIKQEWPNLLKDWHDKPETVKMPGGESIKDVSERSRKFLKRFVYVKKIMI